MPLILVVALGCAQPCDCGQDRLPDSDTASQTTRPRSPLEWADVFCATEDGVVTYSAAQTLRPDHRAWVEIWRDDDSAPYELHEITNNPLRTSLELKQPSILRIEQFEPGVSTYYACDSSGDAAHDPTLWGDGTVFVHARNGAEHVCWVAGKHHELGRAMGCTSLHTAD